MDANPPIQAKICQGEAGRRWHCALDLCKRWDPDAVSIRHFAEAFSHTLCWRLGSQV